MNSTFGTTCDRHCRLVMPTADECTLDRMGGDFRAITVEAWAETEKCAGDSMQPLVSSWKIPDRFGTFSAHNAADTCGLKTVGFFGAGFDGRYVYFSPNFIDSKHRSGKALRYDTHGGFSEPASWQGYDAERTDGLTCKGYYGVVFDGRYVIFPPRRNDRDFHSILLRHDTTGQFTDPATWESHDVGLPNSYQSAAFDGRYVYCCPGQRSVPVGQADKADRGHFVTGMTEGTAPVGSGLMLRVDTRGGLKDPESYTTYDASDTDGLDTRDFDGAVFDGRYVYYAPLSYGVVLRYDSQGDFSNRGNWSAFDARPLGLIRSVGALYDGRYVYFTPYGKTEHVVRYDTRGTFSDPSRWQSYDLMQTPGRRTRGYDGAFFDGRFVHFIPFNDEADSFHGEMLRFDTRCAFESPSSWSVFDATLTDGLKSIGFNGGAFDGRFAYFAPCNDGREYPHGITAHGVVLRYDAVGDRAFFSLRYSDLGHNGGLCAAMPGPRFLVNTDRGVRSVALNRALEPGAHSLAGTFDGATMKLYIDGALSNSVPATGRISAGERSVSIGALAGGTAYFHGIVSRIRISDVARDADWIRREHSRGSA